MPSKSLPAGAVHKLPADMRATILATPTMRATWEDITPLARNEWICWVTSAKKEETRAKRLKQAKENLSSGKRRPCCWPGCPHR